MIKCNKCGQPLKGNDKFCFKCGSDLETVGTCHSDCCAPLTEEQIAKRELANKKCVLAMILGIFSIVLGFLVNPYSSEPKYWYVSLVYLIVAVGGLVLGLFALLTGLNNLKNKAPTSLTSFILGIIGTGIGMIKVAVFFNMMVELLSRL